MPGDRGFLGASDPPAPAAAILGVPYDGSASFRPGARFAPAEIRWASQSLETYSPRADRDLAAVPFADLGDLRVGTLEPAALVERVRGAVAGLAAVPVLLGGDHLLSLGAVKALAARHADLWVVQLDAHTDLRDTYEGAALSHATVMRRVVEIVGARATQAGVRAGTADEFRYAATHLARSGPGLDAATAERLRDAPVYLTVDIDVLDPAIAPGTGNPEPGGWAVQDLVRALEALRPARLVGCDLVEVAPSLDPSGRTAIVAAWLVRELLVEIGTHHAGRATR